MSESPQLEEGDLQPDPLRLATEPGHRSEPGLLSWAGFESFSGPGA